MCTQIRLSDQPGHPVCSHEECSSFNSHNVAKLVISIIFLSHNGARNSQNFIFFFNNIFTVINVSLF